MTGKCGTRMAVEKRNLITGERTKADFPLPLTVDLGRRWLWQTGGCWFHTIKLAWTIRLFEECKAHFLLGRIDKTLCWLTVISKVSENGCACPFLYDPFIQNMDILWFRLTLDLVMNLLLLRKCALPRSHLVTLSRWKTICCVSLAEFWLYPIDFFYINTFFFILLPEKETRLHSLCPFFLFNLDIEWTRLN